MDFPLPPGFPTAEDFQPGQIHTQNVDWDFHKDPNTGGANFGKDMIAANDGVVVGIDFGIDSNHNTKGNPAFSVVTKPLASMVVPVGFHAGHRLTPGGLGGPGATFKGHAVLKIVSLQDWLPKAIQELMGQ